MELRDYVNVLRRGVVLIVACVVLGVGIACVASLLMTPRFQASTALYVSVQAPGTSTVDELAQANSLAQQKVRSFVSVANSSRVLKSVINRLDLHVSSASLARHVAVTSPPNTVIIVIAVEDSNPETAARIANAVAQSFITVAGNLETSGYAQLTQVNVEVVQEAEVPASPIFPNSLANLGLGFVAGLVLGVVITVLRRGLDDRIHGVADVKNVTTVPILGRLEFDRRAKSAPLIDREGPTSSRSEAFRNLRTNLQFLSPHLHSRVFVVTSAISGEGKTTTAANLALSLARAGVSVAVVDCDILNPQLSRYLSVEGAAGLSDVLSGQAELAEALRTSLAAGLSVLPAGSRTPEVAELLASAEMNVLVHELRKRFEFVIIDTPALLSAADAAILSKLADGAIVVAAVGRTRRAELQATLGMLEGIGSEVSGIVVTRLPRKGPDSDAYSGRASEERDMRSKIA